MKKGFVNFEEAHTLLLCLLYLPIPEFVVLLIFGNGLVSHLMAILMVAELFAAIVVYLLWHRCPSCNKTIAHFCVGQDGICPFCGQELQKPQQILANVPNPTVSQEVNYLEKPMQDSMEGLQGADSRS